MSEVSSSETPSANRLVVGVLAGTGLTVSLMMTLVVPLTPTFPELFDTTTDNASWVITSTLLVAAVVTPVMGRLGDLLGKKRVLLGCTSVMAAASVICALTTSLPVVILGRALQGFGIAAVPLGISLMRDVVPPARLGSAVALMSSSLGAGGALGLPIAAIIAQEWGWSTLFWFAAVLTAAFVALIAAVVPESTVRVAGRIDTLGVVGLTIALGSLLLAISKGGSWGWASGLTLGFLALAVVGFAVWGWWELQVDGPVIDLRKTAHKPVLMTNLASVMAGFSMYAMNLLAPQMLQLPTETGYGLGLSVLAAGLWMAPAGLVMVAMSQVAASLTKIRGPKFCLIFGLSIICGGNVIAQLLLTSGSAAAVMVFSSIVSVGTAFGYAAMPTLIMENVEVADTGAANGVNSLARTLGTSLASALVGVVLGQMTVSVGGVPFASESGMRLTLVICTAAGLIAAALAVGIPSARKPSASPAARSTSPASPSASGMR